MAETSGSGSQSGVHLITLNLPEDEGVGLGFRLTRTLWDPYPWVREVSPGSRADSAGLKTGDCLLQADGKDLLGLPIGKVAGLIRGDGAGRGVSLLVWNCGVDPDDDPELLWSCGGGSRGEKARRALSGVVRALSCCVCASTATKPLNCARSHLYCEACWSRLERCALCRDTLPAKDSPYARNLVAEQVFEAIATEYELKHTIKQLKETTSAHTSPNVSPNMSPSLTRRGQYQISMMNRKKVQFNEKYKPMYGSDPHLHRSIKNSTLNYEVSNLSVQENSSVNPKCICRIQKEDKYVQVSSQPEGGDVPKIYIEETDSNNTYKLEANNLDNKSRDEKTCSCENGANNEPNYQNLTFQHKLVKRLRPACSLVDLQNVVLSSCNLSSSLNNLGGCGSSDNHSSFENLKNQCKNNCEMPVILLPAPPVYVITCDHKEK